MIIKMKDKDSLTKPEAVAAVLQKILKTEDKIDRDKEHFWSIGLNSRNIVQYIELVSLGILDSNLIHPREVYRRAITQGVKSIIIAHNHPSGECEPSQEDITTTNKLKEAGQILGIDLIDHVIISNQSFYSLRKSGDLSI